MLFDTKTFWRVYYVVQVKSWNQRKLLAEAEVLQEFISVDSWITGYTIHNNFFD